MKIKKISAKKIRDSRNEYTIEVSVNGCKASSPSGKSTGKYETPCWHKSLDWNIKAIKSLKIDFDFSSFDDLKKVEHLIKKQFNLKDAKQFGANALYALESAILKALAKSKKKQLWQIINENATKMPVPVGNAVGGGLHSHASGHPVFQEFLLIPKSESIKENVNMMNKVYAELKKIFKAKNINDEGAIETSSEEEEILSFLSDFKEDVNIGIDVASSSFFKKEKYKYSDKSLNREEQIDYINELIKKYNILYCEDPLEEEDFNGFSKVDKRNMIVGDDLTATHKSRLLKAIKTKAINAMIIKPNQNGSLVELKEIFDICKKNNIKTILSHRSGETLDSALADYAFGFQSDYIKCGIATPWREAKLKRLIEIEKNLI